MARTKSSSKWLAEHFTDEFVKRARKEGYRSRAIYKLEELDQKEHLIRPGMVVVDLGAAPGAWSQYAKGKVGNSGRVIALDVLPMESLPGVECLQGDITMDETLHMLMKQLAGQPVDLVISDMAPNTTGIGSVDQARSMYLAELAMDFAERVLKPGGSFLVKVFQGSGFQELYKRLQQRFQRVATRKPRASRSRSPELYLLATSYRGMQDSPDSLT